MAHDKKKPMRSGYLKRMTNKEKNNWGRTKNTLRKTMMEKSPKPPKQKGRK